MLVFSSLSEIPSISTDPSVLGRPNRSASILGPGILYPGSPGHQNSGRHQSSRGGTAVDRCSSRFVFYSLAR